MSAVSIPSRKMPWQTKAQRVTVLAALAIKKEMVMRRLVQLREDEGHPDKPGKPLPVEEASSRAGVKYRTWQRWEAGDSVPYARNLAAIADAFNFDVGEFYDDSGDKAPTPDLSLNRDGLEGRLGRVEDEVRRSREELQEVRRSLEELHGQREGFLELLAAQQKVLEQIADQLGDEALRNRADKAVTASIEQARAGVEASRARASQHAAQGPAAAAGTRASRRKSKA